MQVTNIFYSASFGFAIGVLWRSLARIDLKAVVFVGLAYLLLLAFHYLFFKEIRLEKFPSTHYLDIYASVFMIALVIGVMRFQMADIQPPAFFEGQVGKTVSFSALIVDEPARNASQTKLIVETASSSRSAAKTSIVVFSKDEQEGGGTKFHYGDFLRITGKLEKPANFMTDQDMEFDYINYLRKDGIFYTMKNPTINILSNGHGSAIKRFLFAWRERFDAALNKSIPAPESTVLGGIIIGERYAFSPQLRQIFMDTGTIHIVTIGGYHVTLVAEWIMKIFSFLPKFAGTGMGIVSIFLYVIATGGAQTSIRAGIMATLALFASATGRTYASGRALILAAIIMIAINPFVLVYDVSFELSFMATIAIIFLSPRLEPYFARIPLKWLRDIIAITCSMYMFALPFVLYRIGNLSLVSLPANILIVPLMPISMIAGFVTGFAGLVSPFLALVPAKIATTLLYFQIAAVALLAHLPFAAVTIVDFSLPIVCIIYGIFFWIFFKKNAEEKVEVKYRSDIIESGTNQENEGALRDWLSRARGIFQQTIQQNRHGANIRAPETLGSWSLNINFFVLISPLFITFAASAFLYYSHYQSNQASLQNIARLLSASTTPVATGPTSASAGAAANASSGGAFSPDPRTASSTCKINGVYPDHSCTPGAIFADATVADVCVKGYTASVRNVSDKTKKQVFLEYGLKYPEPAGAYEVDHFIPLALGGANDIANLFPEAAAPAPGFHEKDVVEVFLQEEVCSRRASLSAAQRQISTDWLAVYKNIPFDVIQKIKNKYGGSAVE